jgi:hypothetical protein
VALAKFGKRRGARPGCCLSFVRAIP